MPLTADGQPEVIESTDPLREAPPENLESLVAELARGASGGALDPDVHAVLDDEHDWLAVESCPVCGCGLARPRYRVGRSDLRLVVCAGCGLGSLYPRPTPRQIERFYPDTYYGTPQAKFRPLIEGAVRRLTALRARRLMSGLPRGARVLDVGCGRGVLLEALADLGCEAHGTEINSSVAAAVDPRAEVRIASRLAEAEYPGEFFDAVILWHVLEHLPDPRETVQEIHRILRPGGRLSVAVPNFSSLQARWAGEGWFHLDLPRHLFHYPLPALMRLLEQAGLECRSVRHLSLRQNPFGWIQSALNLCPGVRRNGLYHLLHSQPSHAAARDHLRERALKLAGWLGMPLGLVLSLVEAVCRSGATVHVTAHRVAARRTRVRTPGAASSSSQSHIVRCR